jgi:putative sigma-54 modulation protein
MDILIHADGLNLTEDLRALVDEKIGHVQQYAPRAVRARVHMRRVSAHPSGGQYVVRVLFELPGTDLAAEERGADPVTALDVVAEKIERRLRKRKTEQLARRKKT